MMRRINWIFLAPFTFLIGFGALWYSRYVFDDIGPEVTIEGVVDGGTYASEITGVITVHDNSGVEDISVWLDGMPLISKHDLNRKTFKQAFSIRPQALPQGNHTLKVTVRDASSKKNTTTVVRNFVVDTMPLEVH